MIKIGIVDDKPRNREVIKDKLSYNGLFRICLNASDGRDFLERMKQMAEEERPEVVLMDLEMPDVDGVAAIAAGSSLYPNVKFVVLTIYDDDDKIFRAIKAGAFGYLLKDESASQISDMLWQMHENGAGPISPGIAHKILQMVQSSQFSARQATVEKDLFFDLTEREQQIMQLLVNGLSYKEIGAKLFISPSTAKKHVMNVYQKLHVNTRAQAIRMAYDRGMI